MHPGQTTNTMSIPAYTSHKFAANGMNGEFGTWPDPGDHANHTRRPPLEMPNLISASRRRAQFQSLSASGLFRRIQWAGCKALFARGTKDWMIVFLGVGGVRTPFSLKGRGESRENEPVGVLSPAGIPSCMSSQ